MSNQADQILNFIYRFPGRDDDELARLLKISQRQTVNIICRRLAKQGKIRRAVGPNGKIANYPESNIARDANMVAAEFSVVESDADGEVVRKRSRPSLTVEHLIQSGFRHSAEWILDKQGALCLDRPLPSEKGVYAFVQADRTVYVGVATMGLKKRLYFYAKPGATQRTSQRLNAVLIAELGKGSSIGIYTASPPDFAWNGLPVSGTAGLEFGLIENFDFPWNIRGAR